MTYLSKEQKKQLKKFTRDNSQDGLYFFLHEKKVAKEAEKLAMELGADSEICWTAGLTHDLGYGRPGESDSHPLRSQEITSQALYNLGANADFINKVSSAILSHDKALNISKSPLENVVVCQADAGSFFKYYRELSVWMYHMVVEKGDPEERIGMVKNSLIDHAPETDSYLTHPKIRKRYNQDIIHFNERIKKLDVASLLDIERN
jgi:putative nucleotidyltransferase with HDIG domain